MIKVEENVSMKNKTSFKIGGIAKYFISISSKKDLQEAFNFSKKKNLPVFVLGDGTDILIKDGTLEVVIIKFTNKDFIVKKYKNEKYLITCGAGLNWDKFVEKTIKVGLQGIECLSGIPGTVGAAPVQNIGAYGQEVKDTILEVIVFDTKLKKFITLTNVDCDFSYRESNFKKEKARYFIFEVKFVLTKSDQPTLTYASLTNYLKEKKITNPSLADVRKAVLYIRKSKLEDPNKIGNAGSFFKNPIIAKDKITRIRKDFPDIPMFEIAGQVKIPAGWLIDKTGLKGMKLGGAAVSNMNALVLVNLSGAATAEEVKKLAKKVINKVEDKFDIKLEPEVQYVNF